jgi:hypothetical protein
MHKSIDVDAPSDLIDPFAGVFRFQRRLMGLLGLALLVCLVLGVMLWHAALYASGHVFELYPDGHASFIEDRTSYILPRDYEARAVAREFVELLYGWNGASIEDDIAQAVSMCSEALERQLRAEIAKSGLIDTVKQRPDGVRSEVEFSDVKVLEHSRRQSSVAVQAQIRRFDWNRYDVDPFEQRTINIHVIMQVVRRTERRSNGLEIVRLHQPQPTTVAEQGER